MTTPVKTIIDDLASEMGDESFTLITKEDWLGYLNDGQGQIALLRPDSSYVLQSISLVNGTRQTLPTNGLRLLDIVRNMGADGSTPGRPIRPSDRNTMDLYDRNWHTTTGKGFIKNFIVDERAPKDFYVTPPVDTTANPVQVEAMYSIMPLAVTDYDNDNISLDDIYRGPLRHWMLHRAYGRETDSPYSSRNTKDHEQSFYQSLGFKTRTDASFSKSVEVREAGKQ